MILVIGATGFLGGEICRLLTMEGKPVRAMVRETANPVRINQLARMGAEIISGDLRDPSMFEEMLQGVKVVISTASAMPYSYVPGENSLEMVDRNGILNLINHSQHTKVEQFIYTSFSGNINEDFPLRNTKREVETILKKSGLNYTILRPGYFMEAWLTDVVGFDIDNSTIQICGEGTHPISYVSLFDVAQFAVMSIDNVEAINTVLEIGGPESLSQLDAVRIFEETIGHPFQTNHLPAEAIKANIEATDDPMEKSFAGLMYCLSKGDPIDMDETLKKFPVKLRSVRDYARSVLAEAESREFGYR